MRPAISVQTIHPFPTAVHLVRRACSCRERCQGKKLCTHALNTTSLAGLLSLLLRQTSNLSRPPPTSAALPPCTPVRATSAAGLTLMSWTSCRLCRSCGCPGSLCWGSLKLGDALRCACVCMGGFGCGWVWVCLAWALRAIGCMCCCARNQVQPFC